MILLYLALLVGVVIFIWYVSDVSDNDPWSNH